MRRRLALALFVLALCGCGSSGGAPEQGYTLAHVREVFAAHGLGFRVPRSFAVSYSCVRLNGLRAFLDGGKQWHGLLFASEASARSQERCLTHAPLAEPYFQARQRNLLVVGEGSIRRRISSALAAL